MSRKLRELSVPQSQSLLLREILGMSYREIAEATGTNLFTAASRHRLALNRLRRSLGVDREPETPKRVGRSRGWRYPSRQQGWAPESLEISNPLDRSRRS